jgi:hypothetical protein
LVQESINHFNAFAADLRSQKKYDPRLRYYFDILFYNATNHLILGNKEAALQLIDKLIEEYDHSIDDKRGRFFSGAFFRHQIHVYRLFPLYEFGQINRSVNARDLALVLKEQINTRYKAAFSTRSEFVEFFREVEKGIEDESRDYVPLLGSTSNFNELDAARQRVANELKGSLRDGDSLKILPPIGTNNAYQLVIWPRMKRDEARQALDYYKEKATIRPDASIFMLW